MTESSPAVEIEGVSHWFGQRKALDDVALQVERGSIHGFVGANGAGKTTTLKMVATLLKPARGRVRIFGKTLRGHDRWAQQDTGYMPDDCGLYESLRVIEYLDFFAAAYGIGRRQRTELIKGVLELTDMTGRSDDLIKGLSRGMRQRVALARVLIHDPQLLLLDEPASGLDPRARIELMEILRELRRMGKTIFISSHILAELAELCDAVTLIDRGKVRYSGTMDALLAREQETRAYLVRFADADDSLDAALEQTHGVDSFESVGGGEYRLQVPCDGPLPQELLRSLVAIRADVSGFAVDRRGLDQAFLDLTEPGIEA
ncbi:MAG: ABC transporter ATP-binding protein [Planctomycetota bacterium]